MILEFIFNLLKNLLILVINQLSILEFNPLTSAVGILPWLVNILSTVAFFLPIVDLLTIFGIWVGIRNFDIVWKVIQRIWDALPFT
ncbi:hypothetical protein [Alkaliphilus oremlandii]|uniref:hypothetical protein n=1 Tax=Alkaliphilus oremlandii TaxID=461876 RepID=UPI00059FFDCD|nr:hypothetical protein [Alkaliphilus oremlandii]